MLSTFASFVMAFLIFSSFNVERIIIGCLSHLWIDDENTQRAIKLEIVETFQDISDQKFL